MRKRFPENCVIAILRERKKVSSRCYDVSENSILEFSTVMYEKLPVADWNNLQNYNEIETLIAELQIDMICNTINNI